MSALLVPVTALYAGLLGILMIVLATLVSGLRMKLHASIATDTSPGLFEAVRRHGNFIEWVPFIVLLMIVAELNGLRPIYLHGFGVATLAARVLHPLGLRHDVVPQPLRAIGATLTVIVTALLCAIVIWQSLRAS